IWCAIRIFWSGPGAKPRSLLTTRRTPQSSAPSRITCAPFGRDATAWPKWGNQTENDECGRINGRIRPSVDPNTRISQFERNFAGINPNLATQKPVVSEGRKYHTG